MRWWTARPLPVRVAAVVGAVGLVVLLVAARAGSAAVARGAVSAADASLTAAVDAAAPAVGAGALSVPAAGGVAVRVLDRAGAPVDGGPDPGLTAPQASRLLAGLPLSADGVRWAGRVVTAPDGSQRLVAASAPLVGQDGLLDRTRLLLSLAAVGLAALLALVAGAAARAALRPVDRLRAALPAADRLPVPAARDEVRALAEALNDLLARRDAAAESLRAFTGDAAHELRSPVASIRAQAEVAVAHPDPDLAAEVLADVAAEAQRLSALLDDLLALARADAGERLPVREVDLAEAVRAAVRRIPGPVFRVTAPTPAPLLAAPTDVDRVLDNLLSNAARHARHAVRVAVLPGAGAVRLVIDDDGDGVPPAHRGRVFDRFHRVDDDRDRASGGTGLGLALVAETVRRYGGSARVGESPGGGARFELRWPVGGSSRTANPAPRGPQPLPTPR